MGKTALALQIATHAAGAGHAVGFFSLEMPAVQLMQRIVAMQTGIAANAIRRGRLNDDQWRQLIAAREVITKLQLVIDDMPNGATVQGIAAAARRLHARRGLKLVIVDYLQLVLPSEAAKRRNRVDEITEISGALKRLAKSLDVPVIALAQLNRALEARENKRPALSDLRDSGAIEQDADVVAFIHRLVEFVRRQQPDETDEQAMQDWRVDMLRLEHKAELIVAKHRQGPCATIPLFFDATRTRFYDALQRGN
jgi:replicative DNA helicase